MTNLDSLDLRIHSIPTGPNDYGYDLLRFLYMGGAGNNGRITDERIAKGDLGPPLTERLKLLKSIHTVIEDAPLAPYSKISLYYKFSSFIQWAESQKECRPLSLETAKTLFIDYSKHLNQRIRIAKDLKLRSAYSILTTLARVLGPAIDPMAQDSNRALLELAAIRPKKSKLYLGAQADKQRLDEIFKFGSFLGDICCTLTAETIRGSLPIEAKIIHSGQILYLSPSQFNNELDVNTIKSKQSRERAIRVRSPLPSSIDAREVRPSLINLRIRAEMLIFIGQTGMNLSQVKDLPRTEYRWQSNDENYIIRSVYKSRRQGTARFIVFKAYREHFSRYISWLEELKLNEEDDRLFPVLYNTQIPAAYRLPNFDTIKNYCKKSNITYFGPRALRRTRINWLLRRSNDPNLTADMAAHTKETLLRTYEEGDLQSASQEIGAYHAKTDSVLVQQSENFICSKGNAPPLTLPNTPKTVPQPDCITPEGCLWCEHLRDVLAPDYCWRLVSHRYLKSLEIALFHPHKDKPVHPGYLVIERLSLKLKAIAEHGRVYADWVEDAEQRVREGDYHPYWTKLIETVEDII